MHRTKQWGGKRRDCSVQSGCLAKVDCSSSSISIFPEFCLFQIQNSWQVVQKVQKAGIWAGYIVKRKAFISSMSLALHLERPAHCVWVRGHYTLLFHKMCVELVCTPNWKYREKFIAHVILDYRRWLVYICWVQIPQDAFISIGFRKFQRWINFRFVNTHFKNT